MTRRRATLGAAGEERAVQWYVHRRYQVLDRNWRCPDGELDLVLLAPDGALVFCEVKTRSSDRFGAPAEAVTPEKQQRIRSLALRYLEGSGPAARSGRGPARPGRLRFDVVSVLPGGVEVLEGAF